MAIAPCDEECSFDVVGCQQVEKIIGIDKRPVVVCSGSGLERTVLIYSLI